MTIKTRTPRDIATDDIWRRASGSRQRRWRISGRRRRRLICCADVFLNHRRRCCNLATLALNGSWTGDRRAGAKESNNIGGKRGGENCGGDGVRARRYERKLS